MCNHNTTENRSFCDVFSSLLVYSCAGHKQTNGFVLCMLLLENTQPVLDTISVELFRLFNELGYQIGYGIIKDSHK